MAESESGEATLPHLEARSTFRTVVAVLLYMRCRIAERKLIQNTHIIVRLSGY